MAIFLECCWLIQDSTVWIIKIWKTLYKLPMGPLFTVHLFSPNLFLPYAWLLCLIFFSFFPLSSIFVYFNNRKYLRHWILRILKDTATSYVKRWSTMNNCWLWNKNEVPRKLSWNSLIINTKNLIWLWIWLCL